MIPPQSHFQPRIPRPVGFATVPAPPAPAGPYAYHQGRPVMVGDGGGSGGGARLYDVRLHIKWPGRGEQRTIEQAQGSVQAIQGAALGCVRRNPFAFPGATTYDAAPARLGGLRAAVRRATVDGEDYDLAGLAGDDLRRVVEYAARSGGIPRFEVEIIDAPATAPMAQTRVYE